MKLKDIVVLIICILIPMVAGGISGYATGQETGGLWYQLLEKPFFQPPSWLFGPVWTTLYFLMGVSLYLVVKASPSTWRTRSLIIFGIQLVLNFLWSFIFFNWHLLGWASIEIVIMWIAIAAMIYAFYQVKPLAAWLQIPYISWVTFATVLTTAIYFLNR